MNDMKLNMTKSRDRRSGVAVPFVIVAIVVILGFAALSVDIGLVHVAKAELQRSADAAALAAAWHLLDEDRLRTQEERDRIISEAREEAVDKAEANPVLKAPPIVNKYQDVLIGHLNNFSDPDEQIYTGDPDMINCAGVIVQRNEDHGGPIDLFFGSILGRPTTDLSVEAIAGFEDSIVGFKVEEGDDNAQLLPFTLQVDIWNDFFNGLLGHGDNYYWHDGSQTVSGGSDGNQELNIYPGAGVDHLPPGSFGTVDIGPPGNSTSDIERQILEGVNEDDMSYFGGELTLDPEGFFNLNGDTGISAGFKDELEDIIGEPRAIPLFETVVGPGNNAIFKIVGFAAIRIMHVKLTGPMNKKKLLIQPAYLVDDTAIPGTMGVSNYIFSSPRLIR